MAEYKILVVDDEEPIAKILDFNLKKEGYDVVIANDGERAVELAFSENPDLILLDLMLPKKDGMEVCREVRAKKNIPIIMLTAKNSEIDKVLGLEFGADDYVTKPFSTRELMARVKVNLRRVSKQQEDVEEEKTNDLLAKYSSFPFLDDEATTLELLSIILTDNNFCILNSLISFAIPLLALAEVTSPSILILSPSVDALPACSSLSVFLPSLSSSSRIW